MIRCRYFLVAALLSTTSALAAGNVTLTDQNNQYFGTQSNPLWVMGGGGGSGGAYTGATATQPGTNGTTATPVQGVDGGKAVAVTWTGQTVGITGTVQLGAGSAAIGSVSVSNFPSLQAVSGTITANQGTAAAAGGAWPVYLTVGGAANASGNPAFVQLTAGTATIGSIANTTFTATQSGTWNVGLNAGSAIIGKVGIDQTTPGTTNKVSIGTDGTVTLGAGSATVGTVNLGTIGLAATAANQTNVQSAPGTSAGTAITVQGVSNGVGLPVSGSIGILNDGTSPAGSPYSFTAVGTSADIDMVNTGYIDVNVTSMAGGGLLIVQYKDGAGNYSSAPVYPLLDGATGVPQIQIPQTSITKTGVYRVPRLNRYVRLYEATYTSGTTAVNVVLGAGQWTPSGAAAEIGSAIAAAGISPAITQAGTTAVGKASQGNLYSAYAINSTTTAGYLVLINAAAAPSSGSAITPIDVATLGGTVGATATVNYGAGPPNAYSTGIVALITTSLTTYTPGGNAFVQVRTR